MSSSFLEKTYCTPEAIEASGELNTNKDNDCSQKLNRDYINGQLEKCKGKKDCQIDLQDPTKFINGYDEGSQCGAKSFFYIQNPCLMPAESADQR
jgi:hypothetical protein